LAISGYLDGGQGFSEAIDEFARAYADQNERDHLALLDAVEKGRINARAGI
jgi:hypothetical protein